MNRLARDRWSRGSGVLIVLAALTTGMLRIVGSQLRWWDHPAWWVTLGLTLGLLAVRVGRSLLAAWRGELPWPRLLLPGIFWFEGLGLWWGGGSMGWQCARWATAVAMELAFVAVALLQVRRASAGGGELAEAALARSLQQVLPPRMARMVAVELVMLGLALRFLFGGWRREAGEGFSYHRTSAMRMFLPTLPLIAGGDLALLELVVLPHTALWVRIGVHALAAYGLLWGVGLWASFRARPHRVHPERVELHCGLLRHLEVPLHQIASIAPLPDFSDDWKRRAYCKGMIKLAVAGPAVLELRLTRALRPTRMLGLGKASDRVLLAVDDPDGLLAALTANQRAS